MRVEQTYIFRHGEPAFFVSTMNRMSSTIPSMEYSETLAWEIDKEYKRGNIIDQDESGPGYTTGHDRVVQRLRSQINKENQ